MPRACPVPFAGPAGYRRGMGKNRVTHIVWDWNGTLFHDIDAVILATNA